MNTLSYLSSLLLPTTKDVTDQVKEGAKLSNQPARDVAKNVATDETATDAGAASRTDASSSLLSTAQLSSDSSVDQPAPPGQLLDTAGETLFLSARRRRRSDGSTSPTTTSTESVDLDEPIIRLSTVPPQHLIGLVNAPGGLTRRTSMKRTAPHQRRTNLEDDTPAREGMQEKEADEELHEAERRHAHKEAEFQKRLATRRTRLLPVPGLASFWAIFRHVLAFLRVLPYSSSRPIKNTLAGTSELESEKPTIDPSDGGEALVTDDLAAALEKSFTNDTSDTRISDTLAIASTKSFFFSRKHTASLSQTSVTLPSLPAVSSKLSSSKPAPPRLRPKTLVLDLDETLIHSTSRPYANTKRSAGLKVRLVEVVLEGRSTVYTVYKRPWVDYFLRKVSTWYTVIIFTASLPEYADPVIDWLDGGDGGGGMVGGRLFRSDCLHSNGAYVKDLSVVDADLSSVCLVDNSPVSYAINQANGIPIEGWINDPNDECLLDLLPMLDSLRFTNDVRRVLGLRGFGK